MELTRRDFLKGAGAVVGVGALSAYSNLNVRNAVAETAEGLVYEGRARGLRGHISVDVTLDGRSIASVKISENTETPLPLSEAAIAVIPQRIVDAQTVNVDTVSGATFSSMAIINATTAALEAAGVAEQFNGDAPVEEPEAHADDECDILVLGGGLSGCSAAVAASYSDYGKELDDLHIVIVEKQGFVGGSSRLSGGTFWATMPLDDTSNIDRLFDDEFPGYADPAYPIDENLARNLLKISGQNALQMQELGFPFISAGGFDDPSSYTELFGWFDEPRPNPTIFKEGIWSFAGFRIMQFMDERLVACGIDVRVDTTARELVVEDGVVTGVVVEDAGGRYTISAKKVILATGGFCNNPDFIAQYAPTYVNAIPYVNAGCKGDGITMAQTVGAVVDGYDDCGGPLGVDAYYGAFNDMGYDFYQEVNFPAGYSCVIVNNEGKRFMTDSGTLVGDEGPLPRKVLGQPDGIAYSIFDSVNDAAKVADASVMQDSIFKADTIEELADKIGVPSDTLKETIDSYNQIQASGEDDSEFEVLNADMVPVSASPFYAVTCRATICYDNVGLRVSENCEVVNSEGTVVPNLYAVGEVAYTGNSMVTLGTCMAAGRLAGDHARDAVE